MKYIFKQLRIHLKIFLNDFWVTLNATPISDFALAVALSIYS